MRRRRWIPCGSPTLCGPSCSLYDVLRHARGADEAAAVLDGCQPALSAICSSTITQLRSMRRATCSSPPRPTCPGHFRLRGLSRHRYDAHRVARGLQHGLSGAGRGPGAGGPLSGGSGRRFASSRDALVGGHSKGGNLAEYAALTAAPEVQQRIARLYNHDGPGFKAGLFTAADYEPLAGRMTKQVPADSMVGILMGILHARGGGAGHRARLRAAFGVPVGRRRRGRRGGSKQCGRCARYGRGGMQRLRET